MHNIFLCNIFGVILQSQGDINATFILFQIFFLLTLKNNLAHQLQICAEAFQLTLKVDKLTLCFIVTLHLNSIYSSLLFSHLCFLSSQKTSNLMKTCFLSTISNQNDPACCWAIHSPLLTLSRRCNILTRVNRVTITSRNKF